MKETEKYHHHRCRSLMLMGLPENAVSKSQKCRDMRQEDGAFCIQILMIVTKFA